MGVGGGLIFSVVIIIIIINGEQCFFLSIFERVTTDHNTHDLAEKTGHSRFYTHYTDYLTMTD